MKSQGVPAVSPSGRRKHRFHLRGRKKKDRVIKGKLRIRSLPGAFFVLGIIVVVVGTAMAVAGYWPYRLSPSLFLGAAPGENIPESTGPVSPASFLQGERLKLVGPVIMGIGLFILICANTVLYENRDRETQMLLAQMRNVICSVSAAVPSVGLRDLAASNCTSKHYQWVSSLPAAHLHILTSSEPLLQIRPCTDQKDRVDKQSVHPHMSEPPPCSSCSNGDCNPEPVISDSVLQAAPLLRLLSASSMSMLVGDEVHVPAHQPRRCNSMTCRTSPYISKLAVGLEDGQKGRSELAALSRKAGTQVCVDMPDPAADGMEEQTHCSWPRLDLGTGRRYLKLENKEDSVDRLLNQLEQQSACREKRFGSGPFQ